MNKTLVAGFLSMMVSCGAFAADYTLVSGFTDWNDPKSYKTSSGLVAETLPGSEDKVFIPEGTLSVTIDDDSIAAVNGFKYLFPEKRMRDVKIIVDISTNAAFACRLNDSLSVTSHLVKRGKGTLRLGGVGTGDSHYEYNTMITVEEGMLVLPQNLAAWTHLFAGGVNVAANGTLFLSSPGNLRCEVLKGAGVVTNDMSKSNTQLYPLDATSRGEFSGLLSGKYDFIGNYYQYLTGKENTFNGKVTITGSYYDKKASTLGVAKLGNINEPSSSGKNDRITFGEGSTAGSTGGGKLVYLGDGTLERSNKPLYFADTGYCPVTIDAGANGGLAMEGAWTMSSAKMIQIVLDGANTVNECSFLGAFNNKTSGSGDETYTARITKKGSGIWRFGHNENRKNSGVIAVEEGTLRFDSIAEKGAVCSLGLSTDLYEDVSGEKPKTTVPYAFLLGGGETEGTMEYTGSGTGVCSTRPFAVKGKGRIRARNASLQLSGVSAYSAGTHTLTLDGDTDGNVLKNVEDGAAGGVLALVKEGQGTWTLAGDQTFSGGISVNAGTLVVRKSASVPFKWFRFTVKETARNSGRYTWTNPNWDNKTVRLYKFYLYDKNGNILTSGIKYNSDRINLQGDQAAWGLDKSPNTYTSDNGIEALFNGGSYPMRVTLPNSPVLNNEATHLSILIRLAESKPEVVSVNMAMDFAANADYCCEQPTAYSLEGSVNGTDWVLLTEDGSVNLPTVAKGKIYSTARTFDVPARYAADRSFPNPISVKLSPNAVLCAEYVGEAEPISISSLTVDAAVGVICSGFSFEKTGSLNIVNVDKSFESGTRISIDVDSHESWNNLKNWTITVNGAPANGRYAVSVGKNGLRLFKKGFVFVLR